jgi:2,3-dihydroxybenzoate-AMP ligase
MTMTRHSDKMVPFPADFVERYRYKDKLWGDRTIPDEFRRVAALHPETEAVVAADRRITYAQLDARSDALAARLVAGDPVILQVGNTVETVEALYGLMKIGAIPICSLVPFGPHELNAIAGITGARAHLVQADIPGRDLAGLSAELRREYPTIEFTLTIRGEAEAGIRIDDARPAAAPAYTGDPEDIAIMQLSGGTTGIPKVIPRLHAEYWYNGVTTQERWGLEPGGRLGHLMPIVHNAGIHAALLPCHSVGATLVLGSTWTPEIVMSLLETEGLTHLGSLTSLAMDMSGDAAFLAAAAKLKRLNLAIPAVPGELFELFRANGVPVFQFFGMGEGFCCGQPVDASEEMRRSTVGYPMSPADEYLLLDPDGEGTVGPGESGELCVRGPYTLRGYYNSSEHNARVFTPDGYLRTGDVVRFIDIDGHPCMRIEGRSKDLISRGGEKINASEIEEVLLGYPEIKSAALVAMPDSRLGEKACAFLVVEGEQPTLADLQAFLEAQGVAKYKWPERLEFLDELPVTGIGKVAKKQLREMAKEMS